MSTHRNKLTFTINNSFRKKLLQWSNQFERVCFLEGKWGIRENGNREIGNGEIKTTTLEPTTNNYQLIAAFDSILEITSANNCFETLKKFIDTTNDWVFGHFSYDLKNEVEHLHSKKPDGIGFPLMHFFVPKYVFIITNEKLEVHYLPELSSQKEVEDLTTQITNFQPPTSNFQLPSIKSRITKDQYIASVQQLQQRIQQGDIYEINFCQEFYAEEVNIDPIDTFEKLSAVSEAPFSCFYKCENNYLMCASPERFIKNTNGKIVSQPIKGTRRRGNTVIEDGKLKNELLLDEKERSENVMIVDLVRNDLSRTAKRGTVKVEELFGVYTFKQVHQLISTISSEIKEGIHPVDVIKNAFPMGSMTGAPKIKAMELIEKHESFKRGLFSGSVGYFDPDKNFDFNVVIRSIQYNSDRHYISFSTGGAITAKAAAEAEYDETMVKAKAMFEVLGSSY